MMNGCPMTLTFFILSFIFFFFFLPHSRQFDLRNCLWATVTGQPVLLGKRKKENRGQKRRSSKGRKLCVCVWNVVIKDLFFSFFFHYRLAGGKNHTQDSDIAQQAIRPGVVCLPVFY
jgi:hypothetical protein